MTFIQKHKTILILLIASISINLISFNIGIFWDNVLFVSQIGGWLYNNGLFNWENIPLTIDPGHPPFFSLIMASTWTIFGKTLAISHLIMLPFIFGIFIQLRQLINHFITDKTNRVLAFIIVLCDPTLLSQLVLVSPDVMIIFFFLLATNGIVKKNNLYKVIGLSLLGIVSLRGMMLCAGLFLTDLILHLCIERQSIKRFFTFKTIQTYLIGATPAIVFIVWKLCTKGWIITNPLGIWGNKWEYESFGQFLKTFIFNFIVLIHRFLDFGRIGILLFIAFTLYFKRKSFDKINTSYLLILAIGSTFFVYGISLLINNSMGHRYFVPSYLIFTLLAFTFTQLYQNRRIIYSCLLACLLLGNLLVYPYKTSQGWDASLAHLPYWNLRKEAINYLDSNNILISETATFFPNYTSIDNIELNGDERSFRTFSGNEEYVFYSNVYNLTDKEYELLESNYDILKSFKSFTVKIQIMKRKS